VCAQNAIPSDTSGFDRSSWNGLQLFAWVFLRDRALVHSYGEQDTRGSYRGDFQHPGGTRVYGDGKEWVFPPVAGEAAGKIELTARATYAAHHGEPPSLFPTITLAEVDVINHLQRNEITASGFENGRSAREKLDAAHWVDLVFDDSCTKAIPRDGIEGHPATWTGLAFDREEILRCWPNPQRAGGTKPGPRPETFEQVKRDMLRTLDEGNLTADQLAAEKQEALAITHGVSRETVRKARTAALSEFKLRQTPTRKK